MEYFKGLMNSLERGTVAPVYLFYGPEEYLKEKALEKFKEVLLPQAADFNLDVLDGEETDPSSLVALAENLPFMVEKRLIIVKNCPWFKGKSKGKSEEDEEGKASGKESSLLRYLKNPAPSTCLVFVAGDAVDRRKKLYKSVEAAGKAIDFKLPRDAESIAWVVGRMKAAGKKIETAAARALVGGNGNLGLLNLYHETEKLITFAGEAGEVSLEDVRQISVTNVEENIFAVVDETVGGNPVKALAGVKDLLARKEQPVKILALLARQVRLALQVDALLQEGCPEREVSKKLGLQDFVARKAMNQARKSHPRKLQWALEQLAAMDVAIKKGQQDFLPALENMLIQFQLSKEY